VVKDVVARHGLSEATDVVVGGDSAGGLATYWSADWWQQQLPAGTRFGVAPDSGYFLNTSAPGGEVWREHMRWMMEQFNLTASLDVSCRAAHPADPQGCAFPNVVLPHISAPVFVMQGQVDGVISHGRSSHLYPTL
jgi:pimeloyl-ACP methyl ester carboxylesterase